MTKVFFVFAHPDDETFSSAGTIASLTKNGVEVKLITATRGEAGMTGGVCSEKELGKVREKELKNAAKILGISQIFFLDYLDFTLKKVPVKELSEKILKILKKETPDIIITFNEEGGSKHPDHIQISKAATKAFDDYSSSVKKGVKLYYTASPQSLLKKLEKEDTAYTAFGKIIGTPDNEITTRIDISKTVDKKVSAIKCHLTQKSDWERYLKRTKHPEFKFENFKLIKETSIIQK